MRGKKKRKVSIVIRNNTPTSLVPLFPYAARDFNQTWYVSHINLNDYTYSFILDKLPVKVAFVRYAYTRVHETA